MINGIFYKSKYVPVETHVISNYLTVSFIFEKKKIQEIFVPEMVEVSTLFKTDLFNSLHCH